MILVVNIVNCRPFLLLKSPNPDIIHFLKHEFEPNEKKALTLRTNAMVMINKMRYIWVLLTVWGLTNLAWAQDFKVVIDPGHGGHDPGAIGSYGKEKDINLKVALKLGKRIENTCPDTRVIYTRKTDVFIPLHQRADIANDAKANLFISVHTNSVASRSRKVSGTETYTLGLHRTQDNLEVAKKENSVILIESDYKQRYAGFNPNSAESYIIFEFMQDKNMAQSVDFAQQVQRQFKKSNRIDKGVHQAGFLVLRQTTMPGVLIELGYISNPDEEAYLLSEAGTNQLANSIYQAFLAYKQSVKHSKKTTITEAPIENTPQPEIQTDTVAQTDERQNMVTDVTSTDVQVSDSTPVFEIQFLTSKDVLKANDRRLKGLTPVTIHHENGLVKYTYGQDSDYRKVLRTKREKIDPYFRDAFIVAYRNGEKMDVNEALRLYRNAQKK